MECVKGGKYGVRWYNEPVFAATAAAAAAAAALLQITITGMTSHRATLMHRRTIRWEFNSRLRSLTKSDRCRPPAMNELCL